MMPFMTVLHTPPAAVRAPWHLRIVGILGLLWNASGLVAFALARQGSVTMTPDETAYYATMPAWETLAWLVGTIGGMVGSILLVLRSRHTVWPFIASLLAVVLSHVWGLAIGRSRVLTHPGALTMSLVVLVLAVLLLAYTRVMRRRGVL